MNERDRIKTLHATKQSNVIKFDSPPSPNVGKEGDLGVAVIPR